MIARSRQVALALTVLLTAGAACQARSHEPPGPGREAPPAAGPRGFTLVASGDVLPHSSITDRARFDAGGTGYADVALCHMETVYGADGVYTGYPTFKSPPEVADALAATG